MHSGCKPAGQSPGQPTQLIVPGNKGAAVTVQQLQQIVKGAGLAGLAGGQGQVIGTITGQVRVLTPH